MDVVRKLNLSADSAAGAACVFTYDRQCLEPTLGSEGRRMPCIYVHATSTLRLHSFHTPHGRYLIDCRPQQDGMIKEETTQPACTQRECAAKALSYPSQDCVADLRSGFAIYGNLQSPTHSTHAMRLTTKD